MPPTKESVWKKNMSIVKDVVFIILFLATTTGWVISSTTNKSDLKNEVKALTEQVKGTNKQLEKINETLMEQSELNGKVLMFIDLNK